MKNPYQIVKKRRVTEKSQVLENLQHATSNVSVSRCKSPKAVFDVHSDANKTQIAWAVEQIYAAKKVKVVSVNTVTIGSKKRRVRGHLGTTSAFKKAIVTFRPGDAIDEKV
jgi:large subunit ribosomal protein L23